MDSDRSKMANANASVFVVHLSEFVLNAFLLKKELKYTRK